MAKGNVELDHKGIAQLLKSAKFRAVVRDAIDDIDAEVFHLIGTDAPAPIHEFTTDRTSASISVPAPLQASHGILTRAVEAAGFELRERHP
jgi:hypothetical protein